MAEVNSLFNEDDDIQGNGDSPDVRIREGQGPKRRELFEEAFENERAANAAEALRHMAQGDDRDPRQYNNNRRPMPDRQPHELGNILEEVRQLQRGLRPEANPGGKRPRVMPDHYDGKV